MGKTTDSLVLEISVNDKGSITVKNFKKAIQDTVMLI